MSHNIPIANEEQLMCGQDDAYSGNFSHKTEKKEGLLPASRPFEASRPPILRRDLVLCHFFRIISVMALRYEKS